MTGETHADSLALPADVRTKPQFYKHVIEALQALLTPSGPSATTSNLISTLANASSLIYGCMEVFEAVWGRQSGRRVNWAGFYLEPSLLLRKTAKSRDEPPTTLLLGPFHGRPACSSVSLKSTPSRPVGVCAASFLSRETVVVPDVDARPGHIACDGVTKSEIVLPLRNGAGDVIGVLDIDCEALNGFDEDDRIGLEAFVQALEKLIDWEL